MAINKVVFDALRDVNNESISGSTVYKINGESIHINKVVLGANTLIDITDTTATAGKIASGYTAYGANGVKVVGTLEQEVNELEVGGATVEGTAAIFDESGGSGGATLQSKTVSPTESSQTVTPDSGYDGLSSVSVNAISSSYVGTGVTRRSSSDLTASDATVTAPAGYYAEAATKTVASGTAGTPSATKGTVSNHSVSVTPSVTNTAGYISGSTKTGTAVTVSASELVSGTLNVDSAGTKDVTNYASASIPSGTAGTPTATKGTVSNHSVSITPSVTNTAGYISGSTKTGTAVSVSASELVSGNKEITSNGSNIDVTDYASVTVNVPSSGGMSFQTVTDGDRVNTTSYSAVSGQSITVAVSGKYTVSWTGFRSSTGGTNGSQLYIDGTAHGNVNTSFSNHIQINELTNITLNKNQVVTVRARARGTSYYMYVSNLTIRQTA